MSVCLDGCLDVVKLLFQISYSLYWILTKLSTHDLCANTEKTEEQIFEILIFKFLVIF